MKNIYLMIFACVLFACGSDDGPSADPFSNVPSGDIVSIDERDFVLTGTDAQGRASQTYKWWALDVSKQDFNIEECGEDVNLSQADTYYAFTPDGDIRIRQGTDGDGFVARSWEWSSTAKEAINVDGITSVDFVIRALNNNEVIYASYQEAEGCSLVTWERFTQ